MEGEIAEPVTDEPNRVQTAIEIRTIDLVLMQDRNPEDRPGPDAKSDSPADAEGKPQFGPQPPNGPEQDAPPLHSTGSSSAST